MGEETNPPCENFEIIYIDSSGCRRWNQTPPLPNLLCPQKLEYSEPEGGPE